MKSRMITLEDRMRIAHRINDLRMKEELSQVEFGERVGVGRIAVNRWENRWQLPPMKTVRKIAEEYNTKPEWILYGE
ncbi:helix-turn-helix transcriptional regulator [Staphylococcus warneri]|uniref:helix-turn-helix transcriptional regulator n=1 Tax=Staphylococcus warneri TaxID=1292 RepID=UPI000D1D383D|nr:helix-turn-helix transcriptional regulator [Staphylococcus warneri]PTI21352.1 XRE family transcriptional regulator [Staphylococcus warneri]PTI26697.1 XRE family transcriptional regulator [Staphylococcus warneri]RIM98204.1 XRE family transcriptional regulator [Staphylococcus warneri]RIN06601.1 XRE family transcriptional regulator [Staphylococcus warneri]